MGLISAILLAPLAPVRGVVALAEVIQRQVDEEMNNPANTRRQLEDLDEQRRRGEISADEEEAAQGDILQNRIAPRRPGRPLQ